MEHVAQKFSVIQTVATLGHTGLSGLQPLRPFRSYRPFRSFRPFRLVCKAPSTLSDGFPPSFPEKLSRAKLPKTLTSEWNDVHLFSRSNIILSVQEGSKVIKITPVLTQKFLVIFCCHIFKMVLIVLMMMILPIC